jgi:glycosyltransferase involved in cell wall biosynthesis
VTATGEAVRVAIDIRILQGEDARRGIGNYTRGLVEELLRLAPALHLELLLIQDRERPAPALNSERAASVLSIPAPAPARWPFAAPADARALVEAAQRAQARVLHVASPLHGPFNWAPLPGGVTVATLYDFIPLLERKAYFDRWSAPLRRRYRRRLKGLRALSTAFAISKTVAEDAVRIARLERDKVAVAYPGMRPELLRALERVGRPRGESILAFGSLNPSKNAERLLFAYAKVPVPLRRRHRLRLVGPGGKEWRQWTLNRLRPLRIDDDVELIDAPDDAFLAQFYSEAALVVIPSRAEGFGLPVVEAMACGAPVAISDIPVFREIAGEKAIYFDPADPAKIAKAIESALLFPIRLEHLSQEGLAVAKRFNWEQTARIVALTYRQLAEKS